MFSWINSSNSVLTNQVSVSAQNTNNIQEINDQVKKNEGLLQSLGWDGGVNKSVLIDQLAALIPSEIAWKEFSINPIDINSTRLQKSLTFYNHRIEIVGSSEKIIPVNEWIARMKTKTWVKNVVLENYGYNNELSTGQFAIILDY